MHASWLQHREHKELVKKIWKEGVWGTLSFRFTSKMCKVKVFTKTWVEKLPSISVRI